ncbi:hypothetical protein EDB87DRAFT_936904 [Lactarius vividus]|nr:hypothetical protein EDB87DRAFT_936904 [Lactarius vividus]
MFQAQVPHTATTSTSFDITSHPLAAQLKSCDTPRAILEVLRSQVQAFDRAQSSDDEMLTKWLDPTVNVLFAFSVTLNNVFPPANAVFAGIDILLQAVKDVRSSRDALVDLFGRIEYFFKRLEAYIEIRLTAAMTDIIINIVVEVLSILGIVTKEIGQGRMKKYLKRLVGRRDIEDALQRLDRLTQEEVEGVDGRVQSVDMKVEGVDNKVERVDDKVQGVSDRVTKVDDRVQGVDDRVGTVIEGGRETRTAIQQVENRVTELNRSWLRKNLRKWITPPDPSVNYNTACSAHHTGTAV